MKQKRRLGRGYLSLQAKRRGRKENRLQRDVDTHQRHGNEHGTRPATRIFCSAPATFQMPPKHQKHSQNSADDRRTLQTLPEGSQRFGNASTAPGTRRTAHDRRREPIFLSRVVIGWPPRVRRRPLSEILLWSTGSPASWRVSQTPECSGLLTATRGICVIVPQRQPGKFKQEGRAYRLPIGVQAKTRGL